MDTIVVNKNELLFKLNENKESHRANFELALEGWKATAIEEIDRLHKEALDGKLKQVFLNLPRPEDHTSEYERHIQMLEMDINDTVELDQYQFTQFVQDDWDWKKQWSASNFNYIGMASNQ